MSKRLKKRQDALNVVKLLSICILVIIFAFFLRNWYLKGKEIEKEIPVLSDVLTHQIKVNELYNYVNDADTAVVYMCASNREECRNLEKKMKSLIQKNSLEDVIIYLDLKDVKKVDDFYEELNLTYGYTPRILEFPTMIYFENASIRDVVSGKDVTKEKIEKFLKGIQLIV